MAGLVTLISPLIASMYHEPRLILVCIALAALIPISGLSTQPAALLSRNLRFGILALLDIGPPTTGFVVGLGAAQFGLGYWSLIVSAAAERFKGAVLIWSVSGWWPSFPTFHKSTWSLVHVGGYIMAFNLAQYITTTFDNILLALTQGAGPLGLYDKGYKTVTQPIGQLLAPANRIAVPLLMRLRRVPERYRRAYLDILQIMMLVGTPSIIFLLVMSKPLMLLLLGPQWDGIAPLISWLCLGGFAVPLTCSAYWLFVSQGRARQQLKFATISSAISVVGFVAGLPWGPTGVAAGASLAYFFLTTPLTCWGATRAGMVRFGDVVLAVLPLLSALLVTASALVILINIAPPKGAIGLILAFSITYPTFCVVLLALPSGRHVLQRAWRLCGMLIRQKGSPQI